MARARGMYGQINDSEVITGSLDALNTYDTNTYLTTTGSTINIGAGGTGFPKSTAYTLTSALKQ